MVVSGWGAWQWAMRTGKSQLGRGATVCDRCNSVGMENKCVILPKCLEVDVRLLKRRGIPGNIRMPGGFEWLGRMPNSDRN